MVWGVTQLLFPKLLLLTTTCCLCWGGLAGWSAYIDNNTLYIVQGDSLGLDPGSLIDGDALPSKHFVVTKLIVFTWWLQNNLTSNVTYINTIICKIPKSAYMTYICQEATHKAHSSHDMAWTEM